MTRQITPKKKNIIINSRRPNLRINDIFSRMLTLKSASKVGKYLKTFSQGSMLRPGIFMDLKLTFPDKTVKDEKTF